MSDLKTYVISMVGAGALLTSVLTDALASQPSPLRSSIRSNANRNVTVAGNLTVNGVLHANQNLTVYGNSYTKGKSEINKGLTIRNNGLTVRAGGITSDALNVAGPLHAQSGVIDQTLGVTGNLQAGSLGVTGTLQAATLSGASLALSGAATVGGNLSAAGRITGNGVDAGAGGLTTTGTVAVGAITATSITDAGAFSAGSGRFSTLAVNGNIDFSGASVTGLNLTGVSFGQSTVPQLTVGTPSGNSPPLTLTGNGRVAPIGVDSSGNVNVGSLLTAGNLTVGGNLTVVGTASLSTSSISAPNGTGDVPGPLSLRGSTITLNGNTNVNGATTLNGTTTVTGNSDLVLPSSTGTSTTAAHVLANADVAGTTSVPVATAASPTVDIQTAVTFTRPYNTAPVVTITAASDPQPGSATPPKVWVTAISSGTPTRYTGFTIHYLPAVATTSAYSVAYNYHVVGSSS